MPRGTQSHSGAPGQLETQQCQSPWDDMEGTTPTSFPSQQMAFHGPEPFNAYGAAQLRAEGFMGFTTPPPGFGPNPSRYQVAYTAPQPNESGLVDFDAFSGEQAAPALGDLSQIGANLAIPETMAGHQISDLHSHLPPNDVAGTSANEPALTNTSTHDLLNLLRDRFQPTSHGDLKILAAIQQVESVISSSQAINNIGADVVPTQPDIDRTKARIDHKDGKEIHVCQWPSCGKEKTSANFTKHMRRHTKPFYCTFVRRCSGRFGSKNDWSRHESSQHGFEEGWRCPKKIGQTRVPCAKFFEKRDLFRNHLADDHDIKQVQMKKLSRECHISNKYEGRFWCGFCKRIKTMGRGLDGDKERASHICGHFIRDKQTIADWTPPDGNQTKAEIDQEKHQGKSGNDENLHFDSEADDDDNDDDTGDSPGDGDDGREEDGDASLTITDGDSDKSDSNDPSNESPSLTPTPAPPTNLKRKRTSESASSADAQTSARASSTRQSERVRQRTRRHGPAKYIVCCGCWDNSPFGAREQLIEIHKNCQYCDHQFCDNCQRKPAHEGGEREDEL